MLQHLLCVVRDDRLRIGLLNAAKGWGLAPQLSYLGAGRCRGLNVIQASRISAAEKDIAVDESTKSFETI